MNLRPRYDKLYDLLFCFLVSGGLFSFHGTLLNSPFRWHRQWENPNLQCWRGVWRDWRHWCVTSPSPWRKVSLDGTWVSFFIEELLLVWWIPVWFLNFIPVVDSHGVVRGNAEIHVCPSSGTSRWFLSWRNAAWWTFGSCSVPVASHAPTWVLNLILCRFIECGLVCAHDSWGPGSLLREQSPSSFCSHIPPPPPLPQPLLSLPSWALSFHVYVNRLIAGNFVAALFHCAWESQGLRSLLGCRLRGPTESDTTEVT